MFFLSPASPTPLVRSLDQRLQLKPLVSHSWRLHLPKSLENKSFSRPHSAWAESHCQVPDSPGPWEATQCTQATHRHTKLTLLVIHRGPQPGSQFPLELPSPSPRAQEAPRVRPLESCCGLEVWRGCGAGGSFGIRSLFGEAKPHTLHASHRTQGLVSSPTYGDCHLLLRSQLGHQ